MKCAGQRAAEYTDLGSVECTKPSRAWDRRAVHVVERRSLFGSLTFFEHAVKEYVYRLGDQGLLAHFGLFLAVH